MPGVKIQSIYSETKELPDQDTSPSVWREWLNVNIEDQPHFVFFADPFSFVGGKFFAGVDFAYPNSKKIGGLAGCQSMGEKALYLGDKIYNTGLIGIALRAT
ncbi:MAG: hypothetical protein Ct9H300mP23_03190 [Nitrospinota bacterium]|nr:MAG: hypothetical protein Ct9H300mP23_03190 [Nitrospinota bacterium]